jgi:Holliday junction resolvase RusA-like endonuclease
VTENRSYPAPCTQHPAPTAIRFRLPLPPSTNALYSTVRGGSHGSTGTRRVSSQAAHSFRRSALPALDLIDGSGAHTATLDLARSAYWSIAVAVYFTSPRRRDLDDVLKIAIDVICEGLRLSDNRLVDLHASKYLAPLDPRIEVEIEAFADWSFGDERPVLRPDETGT